ncbi:hypothetical protein PILCRDRAFT_825483 [Piloderma croceum F 1598]|uniref:CENP-V/GFA domain-containing protein n=1 Tax=Piloderma croceum (strain F 1598) TaxID=765440 RepID=A0A0C3FBS0_PILCF|nr:hypothetical protein PILCRDRAFT_825483 [Piloderma croceum F 1598]
MTIKPITGHCLCGKVSYTIDAEHRGAGICHCEPCRRGSGAVYSLVIVVPRNSVTITGPSKEYLTDADSGKPAHRIFCPNCGSQIANNPDSDTSVTFIKAGTLDAEIRNTLKPEFEVYTDFRLPYINATYGEQYKRGKN